MTEKSAHVDGFISPSQFYKDKSVNEFCLPEEKIEVIRGGIDLDGYRPSARPQDPPVIGYLCRLSEYFGLGILVDAFLHLKKDPRFTSLKLHVSGGYTGTDKPFLNSQVKKIASMGFARDFLIRKEFDKANRIEFLQTLSLLSVPVPIGEAFGGYQVEALAAGVPVVQPDVGAYPEFAEATGGGVIYRPNTPEALAEVLGSLLLDPEKIRVMGEQGRRAVHQDYSMGKMAGNVIRLYSKLLNRGE